MTQPRTRTQFFRFAIVGLASNALGFAWYALLTWLGVGPKSAMSLLFLIGTLQTFVFNKRWSFQYRGKDRWVLLRYLMTYACGYVINFLALVVLVDYLHFPHLYVQAIMIGIVAVLMFVLQKYWVFAVPSSYFLSTHHDHSV